MNVSGVLVGVTVNHLGVKDRPCGWTSHVLALHERAVPKADEQEIINIYCQVFVK